MTIRNATELAGAGLPPTAHKRTLRVTRSLLPLLLALPLLSACSEEPEDVHAQAEDIRSQPEDFRSQAARHCTEVINDHLLTEPPRAAAVEVLVATRSEEEPSPDQLEEWRSGLEAEVDRRESVRAALAELSSDDATEQQHWQEIVEASDEDIEFTHGRVDVLESQDWEQIQEEFGFAEPPAVPADWAVEALHLEGTDCQWVHQPVVALGSTDFERAATTVCTEINIRRHTGSFEADAKVSLDLLADVLDDGPPEEPPAGAAEALSRHHEEWVQTLADLEAVEADGAADPGAWAETLAAVQERAEIFEARAAAAESGDADALTEAFSRDGLEHPAAELEPLGLNLRSCSRLMA